MFKNNQTLVKILKSTATDMKFIEVAIAQLVEQRVSNLCEAGSNPVIALKFVTEVLCIISVMEEIPASLTNPRLPSSPHQ